MRLWLFLTFQSSYQIPLSEITVLITVNFGVQLIVDLLAAGFVDKIGYRVSIVLAHVCSAAGLILLAVLPDLLPNAFCRSADRSHRLCCGGRAAGSAGQPYYGSLPHR